VASAVWVATSSTDVLAVRLAFCLNCASGLDLFTCGMALVINGDIVSVGSGAACVGHPLNAAAWLARTLAASGEGLKAGDVMLTDALRPMVSLKRGDSVRAQIGGLGQCGFSVS